MTYTIVPSDVDVVRLVGLRLVPAPEGTYRLEVVEKVNLLGQEAGAV